MYVSLKVLSPDMTIVTFFGSIIHIENDVVYSISMHALRPYLCIVFDGNENSLCIL